MNKNKTIRWGFLGAGYRLRVVNCNKSGLTEPRLFFYYGKKSLYHAVQAKADAS